MSEKLKCKLRSFSINSRKKVFRLYEKRNGEKKNKWHLILRAIFLKTIGKLIKYLITFEIFH